jgi:hypothetical protein
LRFGSRKKGCREADLRKADMLMFLARDSVISNPCQWHDFAKPLALRGYRLGLYRLCKLTERVVIQQKLSAGWRIDLLFGSMSASLRNRPFFVAPK